MNVTDNKNENGVVANVTNTTFKRSNLLLAWTTVFRGKFQLIPRGILSKSVAKESVSEVSVYYCEVGPTVFAIYTRVRRNRKL